MPSSHAGVLDAKRTPPRYITSIALGLVACIIVAGYYSFEEYNAYISTRPHPRFEHIEFQNVVCDKVDNASMTGGFYWTIMMTLNNTGRWDSTFNSVKICGTEVNVDGSYYSVNETDIDVYGVTYAVDNAYATNMTTAAVIPRGTVICIAFFLSAQHPALNLTSGTTISVVPHSSTGIAYPQLIELV